MKKYNIEGFEDFDLKSELLKSVENIEDNTEDNQCLITMEPLTEHYVTLQCGHKFNYLPLYNDLINYKSKFMKMDSRGLLASNQIRCPYCRSKQNSLLDYVNIPGIKKVIGINYLDEKSIVKLDEEDNGFKMTGETCSYSVINKNNTIGGYGDCYCKYLKIFSENNKPYCSVHYKQILKETIKINAKKKILEEKAKIKQQKIEAKEKEKQEKIAAKIKEKQEKIAAKLKEKENKKTNKQIITNKLVDKNEIVSNHELCNEIIKSGSNKGTPCGSKIFEDNLCKRHHTLKCKKEMNVNK